MSIFKGSRYRFGNLIQITDNDGNVQAIHMMRTTTVDPPKGSRTYITEAGDTFENIAYREYSDANKWYVLADVNPHIFWPLDLQPGNEIYIPPKSYAALV